MTEPGDVERTIRRHAVVSGHVQGVWFRDACRHEAESRGVAGWVRNLPDGTVEAVFEGRPDDVEALLAWCRVGPPRAHVDAVAVREEPPAGDREFRVR